MDLKKGKIYVNVTNTLPFDVNISLFGSPSDPYASSIGAKTLYEWDIVYPLFNVAVQPYLSLEYKRVGEPSFKLATFYTQLTYNGLIVNLNALNLGSFWYYSPVFVPSLGYPIYTANDEYVFGNFIW